MGALEYVPSAGPMQITGEVDVTDMTKLVFASAFRKSSTVLSDAEAGKNAVDGDRFYGRRCKSKSYSCLK